MSYQATGTVEEIQDEVQVSDRFKKKTIIVKVVSGPENQYEELLPMEFANAAIDRIPQVRVGQRVTCRFSVRGRKWCPPSGGEPKFFVSLNCFGMDADGSASSQPQQHTAENPQPPPAFPETPPASGAPIDGVDEIPF